MKKRILAICLILAIVGAMFACGGNMTGEQGVASAKEGVFEATEYETIANTSDNYYGYSQMQVVDDTIYLIASVSSENGNQTKYISLDLKGNIKDEYVFIDSTQEEQIPPPVEGDVLIEVNSSIGYYTLLKDGKLAYIKTTEYYDELAEKYVVKNRFIICDIKGTIQKRVILSDMPDEKEYFSPNCIIYGKNEKLYLIADENAFVVNLKDEEASYFSPSETIQGIYGVSFYIDEKPVVGLWDEDSTKQTYSVIDVESGSVEEEIEFPENFSNFTILEGGESGYDLLLLGDNGIYGYHFGDSAPALIMSYLNSDLATFGLRNVQFVDKDTFIAMYNDIVDYQVHFAKFDKVPARKVPNKQTLVVAVSGVENTFRKEVVAFNKSSEDYRIVIKDYSELNSSENALAGNEALTNDIADGNVPDVIVCSGDFSVEPYANQDSFVDFYELLAQDETYSKNDFCENVFRAYEVDGKLYEFPVSFYMVTLIGQSSVFGKDAALTWDALDGILAENPDATAFGMLTREEILTYALSFHYADFVNEESGTCDFTSDTFKEILELAKQYPEEHDLGAMYEDLDFLLGLGGHVGNMGGLLTYTNVDSIYDTWKQGIQTYGEEATPVGFPTIDGSNNNCVDSTMRFAIVKDADGVDGAWEFVKRFVSEEAQMPSEGDDKYSKTQNLPILRDALEVCVSGITTKPTYIGADGNRIEYNEFITVGSERILLEPATQETADLWLDYVLSADKKVSNQFSEALEIIIEESTAYFEDSIALEEAANAIQQRIAELVQN